MVFRFYKKRSKLRGSYLFMILATIAFLLVMLYTGNAHAEDNIPCDNPEPNILDRDTQKPEEYVLQVLLTDIGEIDRKEGTYEMSFWLNYFPLSTDLNFTKYPPPRIELKNGHDYSKSSYYCSPDFYQYKVEGKFSTSMTFNNYPFEQLDLPIIIEPEPPGNIKNVKFIANSDHPDIDKSLSNPAWRVINQQYKEKIHEYPNTRFSQIIATYTVQTSIVYALMKVIFPIILITMLAVFSFWVAPEDITNRVSLTVGGLLTLVVFSETFISAQLPGLNYLTIADKIGIGCYVLFIYSIVCSIYLNRKLKNDKCELVAKTNSKLRLLILPIGSLVTLSLIMMDWSYHFPS